jgi:hypothetical protein
MLGEELQKQIPGCAENDKWSKPAPRMTAEPIGAENDC